eukprot:scaffold5539_cov302-Prasinococcus_capsulatus_cf.AAC.4
MRLHNYTLLLALRASYAALSSSTLRASASRMRWPSKRFSSNSRFCARQHTAWVRMGVERVVSERRAPIARARARKVGHAPVSPSAPSRSPRAS